MVTRAAIDPAVPAAQPRERSISPRTRSPTSVTPSKTSMTPWMNGLLALAAERKTELRT